MTIRLVTENGRFVSDFDPGDSLGSSPAASCSNQTAQAEQPMPEYPADLPTLISIQRAMRELGVGKTKIFSMINAGVLHRVRIGGRSLIKSKSIKELIGE